MKALIKYPFHLVVLLLFLSSCSGTQSKQQNRLQFSSSPYLKEHADNPVDWYEWGDEALNKAKLENKPLLISIGYASCHWCHEMENESFMDTGVARMMNEKFICIKVDREERPDIDQIYMNALQLLTGDGGWPLNAFALPDGKPFHAVTYNDKKSWLNLLNGVSKAYNNKHNLVVTQANALLNGMVEQDISFIETTHGKKENVSDASLFNSIYAKADTMNGGLQGSQKFPTPVFIEYLLQHYYITHDSKALSLAEITLKKMALGGMYDHVAGGFARYTIDSLWRVPHFEKMLYDNGQLVSAYAHAYQLTKNEFYKSKLVETIAFVEATLAAPGGGYYSSLNADTEDGEGMFYAWRRKEVAGIDPVIAEYYHVTEKGNWKPSHNILYADKTPAEFALTKNISTEAFLVRLNETNSRLLKERNKRIKPSVDTKIITGWNSIMLKGYADAYAATGNEDYLAKAKSCAAFIEKNLLGNEGSLYRNFKDGKARIAGFLDDYAWAISALIRLYEMSFENHWIELAKKVSGYAIKNFYNSNTGLFFYAEQPSGLVLRKTEIADDALPSSNALMAKNLYLLGKVYEDAAYTSKVATMKQSVADRVSKMPRFHLQWCLLKELLSGKSYEVAITGKDALVKNQELQQSFLPTTLVMGSIEQSALPLLQNKLVVGKTIIYVCTDKVCKRPEEETSRALAQIK